MQRNLVLLLLTILFLGVVTAVSQAQIDPAGQFADEALIIVEHPPQLMIDGAVSTAQGANGRNGILAPLSLVADEPADSCDDAPFLIVAPNQNDGASANIRDMTEEASDPVLDCMWNNPHRDKGYRTAWYRLIAPVSGRVTIDLFNSRYDTVLAVYSGTCDNLTPLHCSDDYNGFTSEVTVTIVEGETYYVEIADWQPYVVPDPVMQLSVLLQPVDSKWDLITSKPATPAISRHAVVAQGENIYVIGGQTGVAGEEGGLPVISNRLMRFNTVEKRWENLQQIPGAGYSNTTAARVGSKIYLPSGYYGNNLPYDGIHWMYDIALNSWFEVAPIPTTDLPDGLPFAWASAVVPPENNRYYLTGGMSSTDPLAPTASVNAETYGYWPGTLPDLGSWIKLKPMQAGRYAHTAGWIETNNLGICVAGGLGVGTDMDEPVTILHRSTECYQPGGNWKYVSDLNIPRYGAGSVVGPDGKWYVFGGITVNGAGFTTVARTEVYDPRLNTWSVLDPTFNLGTFQTMPARAWPRGAMVGNDLWVVGGSIFTEDGEQALPTIDRLTIPTQTIRVPITGAGYDEALRPDDNFAQARQMSFGDSQRRNFDQQRDFFDVYTFNVTGLRQVDIRLEVPGNNNFDLELYGQNKLLRGSSTTPKNGVDEHISLTLHSLRYYVVVKRTFPTGQPDKGAYYTLRLD